MDKKLGKKLKDVVTGFEGIATARVEYLNGCIQYCIVPAVGEDGKMTTGEYIDHQQLQVIEGGVEIEADPLGGPQRDWPKH